MVSSDCHQPNRKKELSHYIGWESKWDETITQKKHSASMAKLSTYTAGHPAFYFRIGQTVLFYASRPDPKQWRLGLVQRVEDGHVQVVYVTSNKEKYEHWISTASDEVFPYYPKKQTTVTNPSIAAEASMDAAIEAMKSAIAALDKPSVSI